MQKIKLCLSNILQNKDAEKQAITSERFYHNMHVKDLKLKPFQVQKLVKTAKPLSECCQVLMLDNTTFPDEKIFHKFMINFQQLRKLLVFKSVDPTKVKAKKLQLEVKLKFLGLISSHSDTIEIFNKWGVESSTILFRALNNDKNFTAVTEFIKRQTNLRTLGVELYGPINQPTTFFDKITKNSNLISIESLSVILNGQQKSKYPARMWDFVKLCEFIRSQPKLKTLEIRSKIVPQSVLETIQQCCRVKKLMLDIKEVTPLSLRDPDSAEIRPNIFLKSLILMRPIKPGTLIDICSMFPNIEILSLVERRDEINEHLLNISNHLKSLRVLKLSVVGAEAPEVSIPSLQSLYVDDVDSIDGLQKFLNCNTSISDLVLRILFKDVKIDPEKIALLTKGLVNLQSFVIDEQSFKPTVSMLNKIHANCPKLKTLVVCNHDHRHVA